MKPERETESGSFKTYYVLGKKQMDLYGSDLAMRILAWSHYLFNFVYLSKRIII